MVEWFSLLASMVKPLDHSVFIPITKKGNAKEGSNYSTIALLSHTSTVMLKILQARLPQYVNRELPDVQAGFRKGRGTRHQIANICWITEKQESSRKTSISAILTMPKPLTVWITTNCVKFFKRCDYHPFFLPPEKSVCRSRSNMTEDETVEWHHWLSGHEFEQALGVGDGLGSLACWTPWVAKNGTRLSDWTELIV